MFKEKRDTPIRRASFPIRWGGINTSPFDGFLYLPVRYVINQGYVKGAYAKKAGIIK